MLNLYLRYFNLNRTREIVERLRVSLQDAPIDFENVYLVLGDFTGLLEGASEIEASTTIATKGRHAEAVNGFARTKWSIDGEEQENGTSSAPTTTPVEDILNDFQYSQLFEANATSFVDRLAHGQEIDDGLNVSHAPPKNLKKSSCNILCRDALPPVTDPFREAIYRTKSPLELRRESQEQQQKQQQRNWRTEKLTGHASVIREGLCHMAIPRDWTWGGPASDHCPVWVECYKRVDKECVVNGGSTGRVARELGQAVMSLTQAMNGVTLMAPQQEKDKETKMKTVTNGKQVGMANGHKKSLSSSSGSGVSGSRKGRSLDEEGGMGMRMMVMSSSSNNNNKLRPVQ